MTERWFHFVRIGDLADWLMCGWLPTEALVETHHGQYSVLCEWPCGCRLPLCNKLGISSMSEAT